MWDNFYLISRLAKRRTFSSRAFTRQCCEEKKIITLMFYVMMMTKVIQKRASVSTHDAIIFVFLAGKTYFTKMKENLKLPVLYLFILPLMHWHCLNPQAEAYFFRHYAYDEKVCLIPPREREREALEPLPKRKSFKKYLHKIYWRRLYPHWLWRRLRVERQLFV